MFGGCSGWGCLNPSLSPAETFEGVETEDSRLFFVVKPRKRGKPLKKIPRTSFFKVSLGGEPNSLGTTVVSPMSGHHGRATWRTSTQRWSWHHRSLLSGAQVGAKVRSSGHYQHPVELRVDLLPSTLEKHACCGCCGCCCCCCGCCCCACFF